MTITDEYDIKSGRTWASSRAPEQAPVKRRTAGSSGATKSRRGCRTLSSLQRRAIKAASGFHADIAKEFGVSPGYVCMLKNGSRPIQFTAIEVFSATLTSLAFTGEA